MRCSEFLERYSDFRDDLVADRCARLALERHLLECERCRRYDAHVARGVMVLRSTGSVEPSRRARRMLAARIARAGCEDGWTEGSTGRIAAGMLAAAVVTLLLGSMSSSEGRDVTAPPAQAVMPVLAPAPPTDTDHLVVPAFGDWRTPDSADDPLIVPVVLAP